MHLRIGWTDKMKSGKLTAAAFAAEYHWSKSKGCYVSIPTMHPMWARNALNKFSNEQDAWRVSSFSVEECVNHKMNLINRANTRAYRLSHIR